MGNLGSFFTKTAAPTAPTAPAAAPSAAPVETSTEQTNPLKGPEMVGGWVYDKKEKTKKKTAKLRKTAKGKKSAKGTKRTIKTLFSFM